LKGRAKERKSHRVELVVSLGYKGPSTMKTSISLREKKEKERNKKEKEKGKRKK
jgi:hypothetical protein